MFIKGLKGSHFYLFTLNFSIITIILLLISNFSSRAVEYVKYYETFEYVKNRDNIGYFPLEKKEKKNTKSFTKLVYLISPIKKKSSFSTNSYIKVYFNKYNSWIRIEKYNKNNDLIFKVDNLFGYEANYKEINT